MDLIGVIIENILNRNIKNQVTSQGTNIYLPKVMERPRCNLVVTKGVFPYVQRLAKKLYSTFVVSKFLVRCPQVIHQSGSERMVS